MPQLQAKSRIMNNELQRTTTRKKKLLIGITSGIAAYKIPDLIQLLRHRGFDVSVIMTDHAARMIHPGEFIKSSRNPVHTTLYPEDFEYRKVLEKREVEHIKLADSAELFVIAPATANIIGKIAAGIADDLLTTTVLAFKGPVLLCPSMNVHMWNNPAVVENIVKLKKYGYLILNPDEGQLACGYTGMGRLKDVKRIALEIENLLDNAGRLSGKKILVTAGGTREPIDPVRFITNKGTGKMGAAIASQAKIRGADVLLLRAHTAVTPEVNVREKYFETGAELESLIKSYSVKYDYIFHTAAVSDFIPYGFKDEKIKSGHDFTLKLRPAEKILHKIKIWNPGMIVIGFKAVYKTKKAELIRMGMDKLRISGSDYIMVNDVGGKGIGFGSQENEVYVISPEGFEMKISKAEKSVVARKILDFVFRKS